MRSREESDRGDRAARRRRRRMTIVDVRAAGRFLVRGTRRAVITVLGFALVLLGVAGLVLPVLPGWVLIIGGVAGVVPGKSLAGPAPGPPPRETGPGGGPPRVPPPRGRRAGAARGGPARPARGGR